MGVGLRASDEIRAKAEYDGVPVSAEVRRIGFCPQTELHWRHHGIYPSSYHLLLMHKAGYDVMYILLGDDDGKRSRNKV